MATTTLTGVNTPPAQTWNYLHINSIDLEVPEPSAPGCPVPDDLASIEMGAGTAATAWVDKSVTTRGSHDVPASGESRVNVSLTATEPIRATDVRVGSGARAHIVVSAAADAGTLAHNLRVEAAAGARVLIDLVVAVGADVTLVDNVGVSLGTNASCDIRHFVLGAGTSALGTCVALDGAGSSSTLATRYLVDTGCTLDMNYLMRQRGQNTTSDIDVEGVLREGATKNLCDTIDLIHGCKGAQGNENETVLLAGERVHNMSLPTILCDEDDVAGNHGATIGSVSPEQLAYMAHRGLSEEDVTELFCASVAEGCVRAMDGDARTVALAGARAILGEARTAELEEEL